MDATGTIGRVGYMLQKDLLLPWRTVLDNVMLGMEIRGTPKRAAREHALAFLQRYGLGGFEHSYPSALSGGMRQRAALLRTLLVDTDVILLDEPFGALDAQTRTMMQEWLLQIWGDFGKTVVFVTHDVEEAIFLSDEIHVMAAASRAHHREPADRPAAPARARGRHVAALRPHQAALPRPCSAARPPPKPPEAGDAAMSIPATTLAVPAAEPQIAPQPAAAAQRGRPVVRRLPVQRDWPTWAIVLVQVGILVAIIGLWETGARLGWIDAFFWSQPSAIWNTLLIFFSERRRRRRHRLHLPLDHPGLPGRHDRRLAARPLVLVVAQLCGDRAALHHLPGVDAEARARAAHHAGARHGARLQGRDRRGADHRGLDAHHLCAASRRSIPTASACSIRSAPAAGRCSPSWSCPRRCRGSSRCLRVNIGLALTGSIVGEFIASQHGLGRTILYAGQTYEIALVWVAVFVLSTLADDHVRDACRGSSGGCSRASCVDFPSTGPSKRGRPCLTTAVWLRSRAPRSSPSSPFRHRRRTSACSPSPSRCTAIGYLPMYIAIHKGYFATEGLDIKVTHHRRRLGAHQCGADRAGLRLHRRTGAQRLRQGQGRRAARRRELRRPRQCLLRARRRGIEPTGSDWPAYFKGKAIAVSAFGGTPNSITRYLLAKWKLDPRKDVTLLEMLPSGVPAAVKAGQAQIGVTTEPAMTQGDHARGSGASRSSTFPRSSAPTPIRPSTYERI